MNLENFINLSIRSLVDMNFQGIVNQLLLYKRKRIFHVIDTCFSLLTVYKYLEELEETVLE